MSPLRSSISECQFYPSCSHFSSEAINEFGVAKGIILTADRFIRCSGGTLNPNDYPRSNKKLIDKPNSNKIWGDKNLWNLTFNKSSNKELQESPLLNNQNTSEITDGKTYQTNKDLPNKDLYQKDSQEIQNFTKDFEFSKLLFQNGNFDNSIYELRKINFYSSDTLIKNKANLLISINFLKMNKYAEARKSIDLTNLLITNYKIQNKIENIYNYDNLVVEYIINDLDNANTWNLNRLNEINNKLEIELNKTNDSLINNFLTISNKLIAYTYFKTVEINSSFDLVKTDYKTNKQKIEEINSFLKKAQNITGYSPALAGILSTILPGSGYVYCGHYKEGLSALIINSLLGAGVYSQVKSKNIGTAVFTSLVTLPFYLGNIVGSYNTAENENLKTKQVLLNEYRHLIGINVYFSDIYYLNLFDK